VTPCPISDQCNTEATGVNLPGQVSGIVADDSTDGVDHAFIWDAATGATTLLRANSEAYAVNGVGELVGGYQNVNGRERAFLWDGSTFKDMGTLGGKQAVATATPEKDVAVGCAQTPTGAWHPFLYKNGAMHDLGLPPGFTRACAYSANQRGQIVGGGAVGPWRYEDQVGGGACRSWSRSSSGKYTRIVASPAGTCLRATHVDPHGVVAVSEGESGDGAYTWKAGTGLTQIRPANVPFGDDLNNGYNCPLCSVLIDGVASSNVHGQLLLETDDQRGNDDSLGTLLTPIQIYAGSSPAITWGAGWTTVASKGAWRGGVDLASNAGATMTFSFTGKRVSVIAPTGPGLGSATVRVDGANPTTIDENATSGTRQRVFQATFPIAGEHILQIVAGSGFQVDALTTTQY
jgi:probable HAF family extracellular repeat protein